MKPPKKPRPRKCGTCPHCGVPIYATYVDGLPRDPVYACTCRLLRVPALQQPVIVPTIYPQVVPYSPHPDTVPMMPHPIPQRPWWEITCGDVHQPQAATTTGEPCLEFVAGGAPRDAGFVAGGMCIPNPLQRYTS